MFVLRKYIQSIQGYRGTMSPTYSQIGLKKPPYIYVDVYTHICMGGAKHRAKSLNLDKEHMGAPCITLVIFPQV